MPLPRFDFAPHEWPPLAIGPREGVADAVFRVVWDGEEVEVAVREVNCDSHDSVLFLMFSATSTTIWMVPNTERPHRLKSFFNKHEVEKYVKEALHTHDFGRSLQYETKEFGPQWLYTSYDGKAGCWNEAGTSKLPARFRLSPEHSLEDTLEDANSDARFALWWTQQIRMKQIEFATRFSRGLLKELNEVVRALATLEKSVQKHGRISFSGEFRYNYGTINDKPNARMRRWAKYLRELFEWEKDAELAKRHLCIEDFYVGRPIYIEVPAKPSQHERLEAALFLREWATGKIPPDELALLLPKL